jgi:hypothetical protein
MLTYAGRTLTYAIQVLDDGGDEYSDADVC